MQLFLSTAFAAPTVPTLILTPTPTLTDQGLNTGQDGGDIVGW